MRLINQHFERLNFDEITYWEVQDVEQKFLPYLMQLSTREIRKGYFCRIPLRSFSSSAPPRLFGLVVSCFPDVARFEQLHRIEILLPRVNKPPALITVGATEFNI